MCAAIQDLLVNRLWQRRLVDHRTDNILLPVRMDSGLCCQSLRQTRINC